ncbi:MAG TPA: hypothetical protein VL882_11160 [Vicinamibacterales bacterium]|nr:hypothetical protein [Vicinamibacterales bacterium]
MVTAQRVAFALLTVLGLTVAPSSAQTLTVDTAGDSLRIRAPGFSFLNGDPLARLKDGRSVRVELAAMVLPAPGKSVVAATRRIVALSYDLWEERFAVTTVEKRAQSASHLALAAAEAWCVDQVAIPLNALGAFGRDLPFWVRLEYRVLDGDTPADSTESGYTLQGLIDALSRRRKTDSSTHALEAGPFRLPARTSSRLR